MPTNVIILAQGSQSRMGDSLKGGVEYKQLLPLPACGGVSILARTIRMLSGVELDGGHVDVVCAADMAHQLRRQLLNVVAIPWMPRFEALQNPGNSSLKGLDRAIWSLWGKSIVGSPGARDGALVLLGDVVYSHDCIDAILAMARPYGRGFVGTSDLSNSDGELWGVGWGFPVGVIPSQIQSALRDHPPFEEYQPGQLRRLIVHASWLANDSLPKPSVEVARERERVNGRYIAIDDYTMDVDLPQHIAALGPASEAAAKDDAAHGIHW